MVQRSTNDTACNHTEPTNVGSIEINLGQNIKSNRVVSRKLDSWSDLAEWLKAEHVHDEPKETLPYWIPCSLIGETRADEYVKFVTVGVLDLDTVTHADIATLHQRLRTLQLDYVWHSTYNHTKEQPKYRFALRLSREVSAVDWPKVWAGLSQIAPKLDKACRNASHLYYVPGHRAETPHDAGRYDGGEALDVDAIIASPATSSSSERVFEGLDEAHALGRPEAFNRLDRGERFTPINAKELGLKADHDTLTEMGGYLARLHPQSKPEHIVDPYRARLDAQAPGRWDSGTCSKTLERMIGEFQRNDVTERAPASPDGFFGPSIRGEDFAARLKQLGPVRWACEGLLLAPGRPNVILGRPGGGKSLLAQDLALAVVNGGKALGHFQCSRGPAKYIDCEQGERVGLPRFDRVRVGCDHTSTSGLIYYPAPERFINTKGASEALRALCEGTTLLIVDSLFSGLPGEDFNAPAIGQYLQMMARHSHDTGCTIVLLHHTRKATGGEDEDERDAMFGAVNILAQTGAVWRIKDKPNHDTPKAMSCTRPGQNGGQWPKPFKFTITDTESGGLRLLADVKDPKTAEESAEHDARVRQAKIVSAVQAHSAGLSITAILEEVGGRRTTVDQDVSVMVDDGRLVAAHKGNHDIYLVPDAAQQLVETQAQREASKLDRKREQQEAVNAAYVKRVLAFVRGCGDAGTSDALVQVRCPPPKGLNAKKALEALGSEGKVSLGQYATGKAYRAQTTQSWAPGALS
jgi:hypothetical protein